MKKKKYRKIEGNQDRFIIITSKDIGEKIRERAYDQGVSLSKYLGDIVEKHIDQST